MCYVYSRDFEQKADDHLNSSASFLSGIVAEANAVAVDGDAHRENRVRVILNLNIFLITSHLCLADVNSCSCHGQIKELSSNLCSIKKIVGWVFSSKNHQPNGAN